MMALKVILRKWCLTGAWQLLEFFDLIVTFNIYNTFEYSWSQHAHSQFQQFTWKLFLLDELKFQSIPCEWCALNQETFFECKAVKLRLLIKFFEQNRNKLLSLGICSCSV